MSALGLVQRAFFGGHFQKIDNKSLDVLMVRRDRVRVRGGTNGVRWRIFSPLHRRLVSWKLRGLAAAVPAPCQRLTKAMEDLGNKDVAREARQRYRIGSNKAFVSGSSKVEHPWCWEDDESGRTMAVGLASQEGRFDDGQKLRPRRISG